MKSIRIIALLLCLLLALGACTTEPGSSSSGAPSASEPPSGDGEDALAALREELLETQEQLAALREENETLLERLAALEEDGGPRIERRLPNGVTLTYEPGEPDGPVYSDSLANDLRVVYEDGTEEEFGNTLSSVEVSPDGMRLLYNRGFTWEVAGALWVYDFESRERRQLSSDGLREQYTPAFADWLDDRYILFIEQFDSGTFVFGGDLCVYDTESGAFRRLTDTAQEGFQISRFDLYGQDCVVFHCVRLDEALMPTEYTYPVLAADALYECIRSEKTVYLRGDAQ